MIVWPVSQTFETISSSDSVDLGIFKIKCSLAVIFKDGISKMNPINIRPYHSNSSGRFFRVRPLLIYKFVFRHNYSKKTQLINCMALSPNAKVIAAKRHMRHKFDSQGETFPSPSKSRFALQSEPPSRSNLSLGLSSPSTRRPLFLIWITHN